MKGAVSVRVRELRWVAATSLVHGVAGSRSPLRSVSHTDTHAHAHTHTLQPNRLA